MSLKRKNFSYNADIDKDIEEWFNELPPKKHSYYIRQAIKFYIKKSSVNEDNLQEKILSEVEGIKKMLVDGEIVKINSNENEMSDEEVFDTEETKNLMKDVFK